MIVVDGVRTIEKVDNIPPGISSQPRFSSLLRWFPKKKHGFPLEAHPFLVEFDSYCVSMVFYQLRLIPLV